MDHIPLWELALSQPPMDVTAHWEMWLPAYGACSKALRLIIRLFITPKGGLSSGPTPALSELGTAPAARCGCPPCLLAEHLVAHILAHLTCLEPTRRFNFNSRIRGLGQLLWTPLSDQPTANCFLDVALGVLCCRGWPRAGITAAAVAVHPAEVAAEAKDCRRCFQCSSRTSRPSRSRPPDYLPRTPLHCRPL